MVRSNSLFKEVKDLGVEGHSAVVNAVIQSEAWDAESQPAIAVVVSTYRRPNYLQALIRCLEDQDLPNDQFEVVIVDNGSGDGTWSELESNAESTKLRLAVARVETNRGAGGGRNAGLSLVRAPLVAFTDDDCLPASGWLSALLQSFEGGAAVIQGRVEPDPDGLVGCGPWDQIVEIHGMTPWFETANVAYRRDAMTAVGGFDEGDKLTARHGGGRAFGEDAVLAARVISAGGLPAFAEDAIVRHRVIRRSYWRLAREWRDFIGFPGLVQRSDFAAQTLWMRVFLNKETAIFDAAVGSVLLAIATRRPYFALGALFWARRRVHLIRRTGATKVQTLLLLGPRAGIEAVGLVSLVRGSVRHRRLVL